MTRTGRCKYCGQQRFVEAVNEDMTQEELDAIATDECDCLSARVQHDRSIIARQASEYIHKLIYPYSEAVADYMRAGINMLQTGACKKIDISAEDGRKYRMTIAGEKIKISTEMKEKKEIET